MSITRIETKISYKYLESKTKSWLSDFIMQLLDLLDKQEGDKLSVHEDGIVEGFIIWNSDPEKIEALPRKVFSTYDETLDEMLRWRSPEETACLKMDRRTKINWLDEEGWLIKECKILFKV